MHLSALLALPFMAGMAMAFTFPMGGAPGDSCSRTASISPLPFVFYSEFFQWTGGLYLRSQDLVQEGAQFDMVLFGSSNGTRYLYHQMRDFRVPGTRRLYVEPTVFAGHFGQIRAYTDMPQARAFPDMEGEAFPGHQQSDPRHFLTMEGEDVWLRAKVRFLLPMGHGKTSPMPRPRLKQGRLVSGARGGDTGGPLSSGLSWVEVEPFYRKQMEQEIAGASLSLTRENWDFEDNPGRGSYQQIAWQRDPGKPGQRSPWSIVQGDLRWVLPLEGAEPSGKSPTVLVLNAWSGACTTWNDHHAEQDTDGALHQVVHRPPVFAAPALGSDTRLRAYYQNRFNNKAFLYYGAELRKTLEWNPFTRTALDVQWLQVAAFAELGRVADAWSPSGLHEAMAPSIGGGMRLMFTDLVLRLDVAWGQEEPRVQMFMGQAF